MSDSKSAKDHLLQ